MRPLISRCIKATCIAAFFALAVSAPAEAQFRPEPFARIEAQTFAPPFPVSGTPLFSTGFTIGAQANLNKKQTLLQNLQLGYVNTRAQGSYLNLGTQLSYRPALGQRLKPAINIGIGAVLGRAEGDVYLHEDDGSWTKVNHWSAMLNTPMTLELALHPKAGAKRQFAPYIGYEFAPFLGYNPGFPVLPSSKLFIGVKYLRKK